MSTQILYIGLDDTDTLESRGTGNLARQISSELAIKHELLGVTRHQLLLDERIPYTAKNSCAAICIRLKDHDSIQSIFEFVRDIMLSDLQPGSDPGVCVASDQAAARAIELGRRAKTTLVTQQEARTLADQVEILLAGLGGSQDGVIGAMAAIGLAAWGEDGRYIQVGGSRELSGLLPVPALLDIGIRSIQTMDNNRVNSGLVLSDKLRPARRHSQPVLFVEWNMDYWIPLKLD